MRDDDQRDDAAIHQHAEHQPLVHDREHLAPLSDESEPLGPCATRAGVGRSSAGRAPPWLGCRAVEARRLGAGFGGREARSIERSCPCRLRRRNRPVARICRGCPGASGVTALAGTSRVSVFELARLARALEGCWRRRLRRSARSVSPTLGARARARPASTTGASRSTLLVRAAPGGRARSRPARNWSAVGADNASTLAFQRSSWASRPRVPISVWSTRKSRWARTIWVSTPSSAARSDATRSETR